MEQFEQIRRDRDREGLSIPNLQEKWKLSSDPQFVAKVRDIVGLYLNPPERAVVLAVDEKSQIQALDRTRPSQPLLPGTPERATHDYRRHGTSSLYAALDLAAGKVIGKLHSRHRQVEFKKFLVTIDQAVPEHLDVHLPPDNASTHKTPEISSRLGGRRAGLKDFLVLQEMLRSWSATSWTRRSMLVGMR